MITNYKPIKITKMNLSNKRALYSVETTSSDSDVVKLKGDVTVNADGEVVSFTGQVVPSVVSDVDPGMAYGSFNYALNAGRTNHHVDSEKYSKEATGLLFATVDEIETKINE